MSAGRESLGEALSLWDFAARRWPWRYRIAKRALLVEGVTLSGSALRRARDAAWMGIHLPPVPFSATEFERDGDFFLGRIVKKNVLPAMEKGEDLRDYLSRIWETLCAMRPSDAPWSWEYYVVYANTKGKGPGLFSLEEQARETEAKDVVLRGHVILDKLGKMIMRGLRRGEYFVSGRRNGANRGEICVDDLACLAVDLMGGRLVGGSSVYEDIVLRRLLEDVAPSSPGRAKITPMESNGQAITQRKNKKTEEKYKVIKKIVNDKYGSENPNGVDQKVIAGFVDEVIKLPPYNYADGVKFDVVARALGWRK